MKTKSVRKPAAQHEQLQRILSLIEACGVPTSTAEYSSEQFMYEIETGTEDAWAVIRNGWALCWIGFGQKGGFSLEHFRIQDDRTWPHGSWGIGEATSLFYTPSTKKHPESWELVVTRTTRSTKDKCLYDDYPRREETEIDSVVDYWIKEIVQSFLSH